MPLPNGLFWRSRRAPSRPVSVVRRPAKILYLPGPLPVIIGL